MLEWRKGKVWSHSRSLSLSHDACWGSGSGFILLTAMSNATGRRVLSSALGISGGSEGNPLFAWRFPKAPSAWLLPPCPSPGGPTWPAHYIHSTECEWAVRWGVQDAAHDNPDHPPPPTSVSTPTLTASSKFIQANCTSVTYTEHNDAVLYADSKYAMPWVQKELEKLLFFFFLKSDCVGVESKGDLFRLY